MADFDTQVLYLENPPVEAPPANYLIGVRMKNLGIEPAATSGFVQVFRKSTGLLVKTFNVASAEMDPGEEKQAFATESLDLTAELPGEQFIFSGDITSPGDTVRSNDILNPTTITVVDEPPPPPPPVASHASQHEDGGSDELDLTGLHGELATPQPYADHAPKHQDEGDDQLNIGGLSGALADPQIPTEHGNERHAADFALTAELTNHLNDVTPHDDALTAPVMDLSGRAPTLGVTTRLAPAHHTHGGVGGLRAGSHIQQVPPAETTLTWATLYAHATDSDDGGIADIWISGLYTIPAGAATTFRLRVYANEDGLAAIGRIDQSWTPQQNQVNNAIHVRCRLGLFRGGTNADGLIVCQCASVGPGTSVVLPFVEANTPSLDFAVDNRILVTLTITSTGAATLDNVLGDVNLRANQFQL